MAKKELPVYHIEHFDQEHHEGSFYANTLQEHLEKHHFIHVPHKHDFYLSILFTKGSGTHDVDFTTYHVKPGYVFMLSPGQTHDWKLSKDVEGYIFFHTKDFYDQAYSSVTIRQFPFFQSIYNSPLIVLKGQNQETITRLFKDILEEQLAQKPLKQQKLLALTNYVYVELSRCSLPAMAVEHQNVHYLGRVRELEGLVDLHYKSLKLPREYAALMNMTEKHLNRICKATLNKTTGQMIVDRIILEAKRLLVQTQLPVNRVAELLGYIDNSYFSRLFKKQSGETPLAFATRHRI
jgi:AraC family transcriptional activator of pobA